MKKENTSKGAYAGKRSVPLLFLLSIVLFFPISLFELTPLTALAAGTLDYNFGDLSQEVYSNTANGFSISGCDAVNYYFGAQAADGTIGGGWVHSNCTTNNQFRANDFSLGSHDTDHGTWHLFLCAESDGAACSVPAFTYDFCNTTAGSNDCGGGGGGGGGGSFSPGPEEVFPGYGASTTFMIIDNPTQDMFNALLAFVGGFAILIWLFKGRH